MKSLVKLQRLENMVGGEYNYRGKVVKMDAAKFENGKIFITSGAEVMEIAATEIAKFIPVPRKEFELTVLPKNGKLAELRDTVLANIEKIKIDANFIPQAEAMNSSINALVNLAKLELNAKTRIKP